MSYLAAVLAPAVLLPERLAWFTVVATLVATPVLVWACREMGGPPQLQWGRKCAAEKAYVAGVLDRLGIGELAGRHIRELSRGLRNDDGTR